MSYHFLGRVSRPDHSIVGESLTSISRCLSRDPFLNYQLMKQAGSDDKQLSAAWGKVGAHYSEQGKWDKAAQYFKQAKDLGMMAESYYRLRSHPHIFL